MLPLIADGDVVLCSVHADAGETQDCSTAVQYAANGYAASFTCTGAIAHATRAGLCKLLAFLFLLRLMVYGVGMPQPFTRVCVAGTTLQYKCAMSEL